jgi:hypothetical protein
MHEQATSGVPIRQMRRCDVDLEANPSPEVPDTGLPVFTRIFTCAPGEAFDWMAQ